MEEVKPTSGFSFKGDPGKIVTASLLETITVEITLLRPTGSYWQYQISFPMSMNAFLEKEVMFTGLTTPTIYGNVHYESEAECNGAAQDKAIEIIRKYELWLSGRPYKYTYPFRVPFKSPEVKY